ncbi:hypothetical protein [Streptomyces tendae]|uniref:hypothetical protein n=1 Tax=Streptomyces tendae TaxID=1932 RepID=UPI0024932E40|nr:hypothetical protein [Streptomyces tendae]
MRRGQGSTLRVSTTQAIPRQILARCQPFDGGQGTPTVPVQRKARREYENRISALFSTRPPPTGHQPVQARDDIVHIATGLYRKGLLRPATDRRETHIF